MAAECLGLKYSVNCLDPTYYRFLFKHRMDTLKLRSCTLSLTKVLVQYTGRGASEGAGPGCPQCSASHSLALRVSFLLCEMRTVIGECLGVVATTGHEVAARGAH